MLGLALPFANNLPNANYLVIATMRDLAKSSAVDELIAQGLSIEIVEMGVSKPASVMACIDTAIAKHGQIDVLLNNAGAGFVRTTEQASEEDIK